jgi:hypothetical protein
MQSDKFKLREFTPIEEENFKLSKEQLRKLNEWLIEVEQRAAHFQAEEAIHKDDGTRIDFSLVQLPYYGAIGGGLKFTFIPNGIGVSCVVTEAITGESIDLTEYDEW